MTPLPGVAAMRPLILGLIALILVACGATTPTPSSSASSTPVASQPAPSASLPSASPPVPTTSAAVASPPGLPVGVIVDPGLLEVLPATIDGVALQPDPATAAEIAAAVPLAENALSIAVAVAAAPGSSDGEDLAVVSVVRLRPDVFDEAFFQEWRDTYDEAACEVADGVESSIETEIGGRRTYVGTCAGGARTYHTYLIDQGFIVSATSTGKQRFGELIVAGLAQ